MGLLTVSNGGITPQRYGRVVAQTEEQLLAFTPEIDFVWGFVYGSSKRWLWFGGVWKVAQVLGKGSIATADPPSASNLGAFFWETGDPNFPNGRLWRYRYLARLSGPDTATLPSTKLIVNNPSVEFVFRDVVSGVASIGRLGRLISGANIIAFIFIDTAGKLNTQIRQSDGTTILTTIISNANTLSNGAFHKIKYVFTTTSCALYIDGALDKNTTLAGWNVTGFSQLELIDIDADVRPLDACDVVISQGSSVTDCWSIDEQSGTTIVNACGGTNGTLSDATARFLTLVPYQW